MWTNALILRTGCYGVHSTQWIYTHHRRRREGLRILMTESLDKDLHVGKVVRVSVLHQFWVVCSDYVRQKTATGSRNSTVTKLLKSDEKKQAKLVEQLAESRKRMSQRLSEANKVRKISFFSLHFIFSIFHIWSVEWRKAIERCMRRFASLRKYVKLDVLVWEWSTGFGRIGCIVVFNSDCSCIIEIWSR